MGRSKVELIDEIKDTLERMKPLIVKSGVNETKIAVPEDVDLVKMDLIRPAHEWIHMIFDTVYTAAKNAKALCSDEVWKRYESWGDFDEHREVTILKHALVNLRKEVISRNRPIFFKRTQINGIIQKARKTARTD